MTDAVTRLFDACLSVNARRSGLGPMLDGYMAAVLAPAFERRTARDEQLAPIRLLVAKRQARELLRELAELAPIRRRVAEEIERHGHVSVELRIDDQGALDALARAAEACGAGAAVAKVEDAAALAALLAPVETFYPPPWWSPLPESVSGVLRAWWRRWRAR